MSKYTTGELAKLCQISVRTVQYYDSRKILVPSEWSEGGRRLYSEEDLNRFKRICFLRELGFSIHDIARILSEENANDVFILLIKEQSDMFRHEIAQTKQKLRKTEQLLRAVQKNPDFSASSIGDLAFTMHKSKKLRKIHGTMLLIGIFMDIVWISALFLGITQSVWMPFWASIPLVVLGGIGLIWFYYQKTVYICPHCHTVFKPKKMQFVFASHTPKTRKLTCPKCKGNYFCLETYDESSGNS